MGKFRSKLKRHTKGKAWSKGQSSTSNPENMKHRMKAKSRFFQPNLSLAPQQPENPGGLTMQAVQKHDARQMYASGKKEPTVNDIAGSLRSFTIDGDEDMTESQGQGTFKTFQTFASNYSSCSNMSFKKLLSGFRVSSELHKEMLAILTALTEVIKERRGTESSTEYFLLLMETIDASKEESELIASISLLAMGIKTVPAPILRKKFSETAQTLMGFMERFMESENLNVLRYIIGCMSVLLRAQDYGSWSYSSTTQYLDAILMFTIHSKPKIRKAAQHAVISIIHGSSFMTKDEENEENPDQPPKKKSLSNQQYHPGSGRVAKFCLNQFKPEMIAKSQTLVLHTIGLLRDTLSGFKGDDIRTICESLLSIMTAANVLLRTNCFQTFHTFFLSRTKNLSSELCGKLLSAIYEYRPDRTDIRQTLAWITVLKEGHIHLSTLDLTLGINALPKFIDICANDLWMVERTEIVTGASNALKEVLFECVRPACATDELAEQNRFSVTKIINLISKALSAPFGDVAKYVILTFAIVFEVTGSQFGEELCTPLKTIGNRYDTNSTLRLALEHAIISAIQYVGVEYVMKAIPLANENEEIQLEKSWLLPLMRESITGSTFQFFANYILKLALDCNKKWHTYKEEKSISLAHTYELLCCQLWGLFPGFCRKPKDLSNFRLIAKTIGTALIENPEFRAPILDGFHELITTSNQDDLQEITKYSKNFVPRLFNIYTQKPNGTYESELRAKILETIKDFLTITTEETLTELFDTARDQLKSLPPGNFTSEAVSDAAHLLLIYQNAKNIKEFYEKFIIPVLKDTNSKVVAKDEQKLKKQQRKSYDLLKEIILSEREECRKFVKKNVTSIENVLLDSSLTTCSVSQAARLKCLKILIEHKKKISINDDLIKKTIPETLVTYKEHSTKKENIAQDLLILIAEKYQKADALNDFVDIMMAGFGGDQILITNTIFALRSIVQHLTGNLTVNTLQFILEQILAFLVQKNRNEAEAAVVFLITFTKVLPSPLIANHLEVIMRSLSAMSEDTKRYCRVQVGYLLKKLCKRFTAEELIKLVPGNDEVTHKRLKKIRKQLRREGRQKAQQEKQDDDDSDEDFISGLEKKSVTIDDILADSDSDLPDDDDMEETTTKGNKKKTKSKKTFIQESPEDIVDLADIKAIGSVMTNKPGQPSTSGGTKKNKDTNRGFKTADDGRLIINDKDVSSDSDENDEDDTVPAATKRGMEVDSSDDEDMPTAPSRKRKALDSISMKTGKSGASSKYVAGGKGIHRPVAASVKSGYSAKSRMSTVTTKSATTEYSSSKAKGDMKRKGKLDPYAYIPLSRNILNKRKRSKNAGQFKNIVTGARKGASKGLKSRVRKAYKK